MTIAAEPFWVVCQCMPQRERYALLDIKHRLKIDCFYPFFGKRNKFRHLVITPGLPLLSVRAGKRARLVAAAPRDRRTPSADQGWLRPTGPGTAAGGIHPLDRTVDHAAARSRRPD